MGLKGTYLRRCHVCGATIEKEGHDIGQCPHCGKSVAPFFYFDERQIIGFGDVQGPCALRAANQEHTYGPLIGIGLFWEEEYSEQRESA